MSEVLIENELKQALKRIPEWEIVDKAIERTIEFDDFLGAIDFVDQVAEIAEEEDHHPEISIKENKVTLSLSTHNESGLTTRDIDVAERVDNLME